MTDPGAHPPIMDLAHARGGSASTKPRLPLLGGARLLDVVGWTLFVSGLIYLIFLAPALRDPLQFPVEAYLLTLITPAPGLVLLPTLFVIATWTSRRPRPGRLLLTAASVLGLAWLHTHADYALSAWILARFAPHFPPADAFLFEFSTLIWAYGFFAALVGLTQSRRRAFRRELQLAEARSAAQEARIAALRFQLNPHFLFNTLNAISSLVLSHRNAEAEQMLDKLCDFLRIALSADPTGVTSLEQELDAAMAYLDIERVRFGDRLQLGIDCATAVRRAKLPGLLIQPLVENAVKHAVAASDAPVVIRISAFLSGPDTLCIVVRDTRSEPASIIRQPGSGVGLANVRARLAVMYGDRAALTTASHVDGFEARIDMPFETANPEALK